MYTNAAIHKDTFWRDGASVILNLEQERQAKLWVFCTELIFAGVSQYPYIKAMPEMKGVNRDLYGASAGKDISIEVEDHNDHDVVDHDMREEF